MQGPTKIDRIAPFTIEAEKKEKLRLIGRAHRRDLTSQLRFLIDQCIADHEKGAA